MPWTEWAVQPALSTFTVSVMAVVEEQLERGEFLEPDATDASNVYTPAFGLSRCIQPFARDGVAHGIAVYGAHDIHAVFTVDLALRQSSVS